MYRNMKIVPSPESSEYEAFALEEWRKVRDGVNINGVYISGWLYWHLNHWKIYKDDRITGDKIIANPDLRDNEWMIAEGLIRAEEIKGILVVCGARQIAKTTFSSSFSGRAGTIKVGSQNIIVGASKVDLSNITNDLDLGLQNVTPMFRINRITRDWKTGEVYLGVKSKSGDNQIHSMYRLRNTEGGANTEIVAGVRADSALFDEIGKGPFKKVLEALRPAMRGPNGWRAPILMTGTGGDMSKAVDAESIFTSPDENDVVAYLDERTGKKTGLFMPGWLRQDFKKESNLADYLNVESEELSNIKMYVSDKEEAVKVLERERAVAAKDSDSSKLLKRIMYDPLTVDEVFLSEDNNIFPKELLLDQKRFLANTAPPMDAVELYLDGDNKVRHNFTAKRPVANYPIKPEDNKEGVVQIWEMPLDNVPAGTYIAATDPYKHSESAYSDSLGCTYIFKRTYDLVSDRFQNTIVAAYTGRPKSIHTWYNTTKLLLKFYNAKTLCENQDYGFIQHLIDKNEAPFFLVPQPQFLYDIHPNTTVNRNYGIHMTNDIKNYIYRCIIEYLTDVIKTEKVNGESKEVLGVRRIIDPMLLEELIKYNPEANADRLIAFGLVLAYAKSLDKIPLTTKVDNRVVELYRGSSKRRSPFNMTTKSPW